MELITKDEELSNNYIQARIRKIKAGLEIALNASHIKTPYAAKERFNLIHQTNEKIRLLLCK